MINYSDSNREYLGRISSSYDRDSIFNEFGQYGGELSSKSIWNEFSTYGNSFNSYSPFNEYSQNPPILIKNQSVIAVLTFNDYIQNSINPYILKACKF